MPKKNNQPEVHDVPKLRFPGFSSAWEEKKLGDLSTRIGDGIHTTPLYDIEGDYFFVNGNNLVNGRIQLNRSTKRVSYNAYLKHKRDLDSNTILISINGTIGNIAIYNNEKVVLGKSACYVKLSKETDRGFIFNLLGTNKIQSDFIAELTGSTIKNLSLKSIKNTKIYSPKIEEQQKIGEFLKFIDEWTENLKGQKQSFELYKKSIMQKIFSQEIRFKDEKDKKFPDWEHGRLGDVCEKKSSNISANSLGDSKGQYKVYGATGFLQNVDFYREEKSYVSIVKDGAGVGRLLICEPKTSVLGTLGIIKAKDGMDLNFVYLLMKKANFIKYTIGSTIPHIYFKDYRKEKVLIPAFPEQQKIAEFLALFDKVIECKQQEIIKAEQWKKSLI